MVKVLSTSFEQCFGPFTMLLCEGYSQTGLFRHLPTTYFGVLKFKHIWGSSFFWKSSKLNLNLEMVKKNSEKMFSFWDIWIWKCSYKLSLLGREYLLWAVNGLTNSPKFWISLRETFSTWVALTGINKYPEGAVVQISTVFRPV